MSPDGRIDSLSVEITSPLEGLDPDDLARRAREIVAGEDKVIEAFLGKQPAEPEPRPAPRQNGNGAEGAPARMLSIRGMVLTFKVNGDDVRLFGKRRIAAALAAAGMPLEESVIGEGLELDVPCRVVTGRTPDGRYLSIDKVLPASTT